MRMGAFPDDPGLNAVLAMVIPDGPIFDFGFGAGQHLWPLAERFPGRVVGLDIHPSWFEEASLEVLLYKHDVRLLAEDALQFPLPEEGSAIIVIGMTVYLTKDRVRSFVARAWQGLLPGGILMVSFATYDDFVLYALGPRDYPLERGSYQVNCPCGFCGNYGLSVWDEEEALELLLALSGARLIDSHRQETVQDLGEGIPRDRSFLYTTVQKTAV
ncbi:class I SAM-dependent methyltransferase [candidate division WWE3 bacterium]|nr:class I SAM-dependent methyltransferase [candidate division WWE3 bacterium]